MTDCRSFLRSVFSPLWPASLRPLRIVLVLALSICLAAAFANRAHAGDNLFNSTAAVKEEVRRIAGEGRLFLKGPLDPHLAGTAAAAGLFLVAYTVDKDIRTESSGRHGGVMRGITDVGNDASNPFLHLGIAAAVYTGGAVADDAGIMALGQEMGEALVLADAATFVLKGAIGRGRPYRTDSNSRFRPFQFRDGYDSLPSMHTASSFALAQVAAARSGSVPARIACYTAAGLAAFSRVYQGKHWASDVVLGAGVGILAGDAVTRYRALAPGTVTLAPTAVDGNPALALIGTFQ